MSLFGPKVVVVGGKETHNHTTIQMVDPSIEKGARFLDEVQEKAHERIVQAMLIEVPTIGVSIVRYEIERVMATMDGRHRIAFTLNGRQFDFGVEHKDWENPERVIEIVVDRIAREILSVAFAKRPLLAQHIGFRRHL